MATSDRLITGYVPKIWLTGVGLGCFTVLAAIFWLRLWRQGRRFMLTLCIGTTCMAVGFAARIPMTNQPGSLGIYIAQTMFILLSPCAFLAQDYIILPRLATWLDAEDCLFLKSRIIVRVFVWSDVITFWLQGSGGGMTAVQSSTISNIGYYISLAGLCAQCASFAVFTALLIVFGFRVRSRYPHKWTRFVPSGFRANGTSMVRLGRMEDWRTLYFALLWTCIGIFVRSIFRVIEYAQGYNGTLRTTEVYFYVLDSLPLFLALAVWTIVWPPVFLPTTSPFSETPETDEIVLDRTIGVGQPVGASGFLYEETKQMK